jgi:hypothetical protein
LFDALSFKQVISITVCQFTHSNDFPKSFDFGDDSIEIGVVTLHSMENIVAVKGYIGCHILQFSSPLNLEQLASTD